MTTRTSISANSQTHEPSEENNENQTTNINQNGKTTVSIGVGQETTPVISPKNPKTSETIGDECTYIGDVYVEKKHGNGTLSWSDGRVYTGAFYTDKRHGFGTFQIPNISEFKGLYRHDERFGPGILTYKTNSSVDVGFWLSEDLARLLNHHPKITLDIEITHKKSLNNSSLVIPSWYSPEELLSTLIDQDFLLKSKSNSLFCKNLERENTFSTNYLIEHANKIQEVISDKRAQLDAYLNCLIEEERTKDKFLHERMPDILPPNQTYEQKQLYDYTNKFWPLKQQAKFPIEKIVSNTRSAFPNAGPLENASLNLFEYSFNGQFKHVRDLLMHHQVYVDVCDSRGLTALHFATYNVHINIVNILLDFGANVNQLSDDELTPLSIAFLLYYGNNPKDSKNIALEHTDPVLLIPRPKPVVDKRRTSLKEKLMQQSRTTFNSQRNLVSQTSIIEEDKYVSSTDSMKTNDTHKKNPYGYKLTDALRHRIRDEQLRESVYDLIKVLLRRGADPSLSDWPLPVLAFAIRAGDKEMVELLLKKKAQVNCRLNSIRHVHLTPLHIACGCLSSTAVDIVQLLLKYGANVHAETLPGGKEYISLADPTVLESNRVFESEEHGRTPLHIACAREPSADTLSIVRILLEHKANVNAICNGQTPLSLAIALGNESLVNLLLEDETTDPSITLGLGNGNALCSVLTTIYEPRWTYNKRLELIEKLVAKNPKVLYPIRFGPKNALGSAVDYAYYAYFADPKIYQTPFHALTSDERVIFKQRKDLLAHIAKRFREEVIQHEDFLRLPTPIPGEGPTPTPTGMMLLHPPGSRARSVVTARTYDTNNRGGSDFQYCASCGRSVGVRLALCKRCRKVYFCSKACRAAALNNFHRHECKTPFDQTPSERPDTTVSSKDKLPSLRPDTIQTDNSQLQSVGNIGTRFEKYRTTAGKLFTESVLSVRTTQNQTTSNSRLPALSVAKLIRQKRLKKLGKSTGDLPPTLPACLEGIHLSWNPIYNAPENYSFN